MKPKPSASVLRVLAALGLSLLLLAACKKHGPEELAGAASGPAADPLPGLLATEAELPDLAVVLAFEGLESSMVREALAGSLGVKLAQV